MARVLWETKPPSRSPSLSLQLCGIGDASCDRDSIPDQESMDCLYLHYRLWFLHYHGYWVLWSLIYSIADHIFICVWWCINGPVKQQQVRISLFHWQYIFLTIKHSFPLNFQWLIWPLVSGQGVWYKVLLYVCQCNDTAKIIHMSWQLCNVRTWKQNMNGIFSFCWTDSIWAIPGPCNRRPPEMPWAWNREPARRSWSLGGLWYWEGAAGDGGPEEQGLVGG